MYESTSTEVTDALKGASPTFYNDDTISKILDLATKDGNTTVNFDNATVDLDGNVTVAAGAEVVFVASSDDAVTTIKPPVNVPVVIFQGKGGVDVDFSAGTSTVVSSGGTDRLVVGSSGNDSIVLDSKNTKLVLGTGNSTVHAGTGSDTIEAGNGNSTITGGDHTIVKLGGGSADYTVTVVDGHAVITHVTPAAGPAQGATTAAAAISTDISHVQYVQLDNNEALIIANDEKEAGVASLYHAAFGRDADASGIDFWFAAAKAGASLEQIAQSFTTSAEFEALSTQTNAQFLESLYQNTFARGSDAEGLDFWTNLLETGFTRAEVLANFANVAALNDAGTLTTEVETVGSVTIVHGIV
jgi:hypothetical protein